MCRIWALARGMALNWPNAGPGKVSLHDLWVDGGPLAQPDRLADQDGLLGSGQCVNPDDALVVTGLGALAERRQVAAKVVPLPARARRAVDEPVGTIAPCRHVSTLAPDGPCSTFVEPHLFARGVQRRQHRPELLLVGIGLGHRRIGAVQFKASRSLTGCFWLEVALAGM